MAKVRWGGSRRSLSRGAEGWPKQSGKEMGRREAWPFLEGLLHHTTPRDRLEGTVRKQEGRLREQRARRGLGETRQRGQGRRDRARVGGQEAGGAFLHPTSLTSPGGRPPAGK